MKAYLWTVVFQACRAAMIAMLIAALPAVVWAEEAPALDVTDGCGSQVIGKYLSLLRDEQRSMTINDVTAPPLSSRFDRSTSEKPNFGFTEAAYWVRFILVNRGSNEADCLLELDYPSMDTIELFTPRESGGFDVRALGDQEPFEARALKNPNPVFEVFVGPQSTQTLTLRLASSGAMQIALRIHDPLEFLRIDRERQIILGIYCGFIFVMILYNLFLFFGIRDRAYLAYVGYVVSVATLNLSLDGVTYEYLLSGSPIMANKIVLTAIMGIGLFGSIFASLFLKTKSQGPIIHRFFVVLIIYFITSLPLVISGPYDLGIKLCALTSATWCLFIFFCSIYVWKVRGYAPARFFVLAWTTFLIATVLFSLRGFGLVPNVFVTAHGVAIGSAMEVVLLSFALADRIKILEREKNTALTARLAEQEHAENIQREAARAWQTTFDTIGSGICLLDNTGTILQANQAACELLGQNKEDIVGTQIRPLLKDGRGSQSFIPPAVFDVVVERVERFMEFKDGWYLVRHDPILDADEDPVGSVHIMTDVTQQRKLEEQLQQAQKMDAIGRLAGGVAHDFNNLLSVIISYGESIAEVAPDAESKTNALEIVKAGHRAAALTRQLLVFSRKKTHKFSVIDPDDAVNDLSKMLSRLIGANHKLHLELGAKPVRIYFDRAQLEQILVNLVVNARDAMPTPGDIIIETQSLELLTTKHVTTGELPAGRYVSLCVKDSGTGIESDILTSIFDPFFTTKGPGKGAGLGLSMVYGSVLQVGGFIDVSSTVGGGSQFTVYLPRVDEAEVRPSRIPVWDKGAAQNQTVLVVDDEAPVRAAICKILRSEGFAVLEAGSATAALKVLEQATKPVDILLTDIVMEGLSGVELVARIADSYPRMQILYMSGYGFEVLSEQGIDPVSVHVLDKPFSRGELLMAVEGSETELPSASIGDSGVRK